MENYLQVLCQSPLFAGAAEADARAMLQCLGAVVRRYGRGEFVLRSGGPADQMGVVLSGGLQVCREDALGYRTILAALGPGELFGEAYACARTETLPVSVLASADSAVVLLDGTRLLTTCPTACRFHGELIRNLTSVLARKNVFLTRRMEHLSKRTLREKLLSYLEEQAAGAGGATFEIPLDRQGLADYLCADRSALSRELGTLKREGVVAFERSRFRLLYPAEAQNEK